MTLGLRLHPFTRQLPLTAAVLLLLAADAAVQGTPSSHYFGCFLEPFCGDPEARIMVHLGVHPGMTVESCKALASGAGYIYAGMQHFHHCFGGNDITAYTQPGRCDEACDGDHSQMCGGPCSNSLYLADGTESLSRTMHRCDIDAPSIIQCPANHTVTVSSAWFGQPSPTRCLGPSGPCPGYNVTADLQASCNNRATCIVGPSGQPLSSNFAGGDPCAGVLKFIEVNYTCVAGTPSATNATSPAPNPIPTTESLPSTLQYCEWTPPSTVQCPADHVISVTSAWFGRPGPTNCSGPSGLCPGFSVTAELQAGCDNKPNCTVYFKCTKSSTWTCSLERPLKAALAGGDICVGVEKYIELNYTCVAGTPATAPNAYSPVPAAAPVPESVQQCEWAPPRIVQCPADHVISVSKAWFGRPAGRPTSCPDPYGECPGINVTAEMQARCDNRSTCTLQAGCINDTICTFDQALDKPLAGGDPCPGIRKYLELTYTCVAGAAGPVLNPTLPPSRYIGCFREPYCPTGSSTVYMRALTYLATRSDLSVDLCLQLARAKGYTYAAVQHSNECFAGNDTSQYTVPGTCAMTCAGDPTQLCGGICENAIYSVDPPGTAGPEMNNTVPEIPASPSYTYIGCFQEPYCSDMTRALPHYESRYYDLTVDLCVQIARAAGYKYAAVQHSNECWFGNDISLYTVPGTCQMPCTGDASQLCGGPCENAIYLVDATADCTSQTYLVQHAMAISWSITLDPYEPPALMPQLSQELPYLNIGVTISPDAASAIEAAGALHWSHAVVPMQTLNVPPSNAAWLPPPAVLQGANDSCAVTAVERQLRGRPCVLYASLFQVADGVYLEVLGKMLHSSVQPSTEWLRAVLRLVVVQGRK